MYQCANGLTLDSLVQMCLTIICAEFTATVTVVFIIVKQLVCTYSELKLLQSLAVQANVLIWVIEYSSSFPALSLR
jgi:hypothetical protein